METTTYELVILLSEYQDEIDMITNEINKFTNSNPTMRVNSARHSELSKDETEIVFEITIEYELK